MNFQYFRPQIPAHRTQLRSFFQANEATSNFENNLTSLWDTGNDKLLVALRGNKVIGAAWLRKSDAGLYIKYMHVLFPYQGIGRKMVEHLKKEQLVMECWAVYEAKGFWRKVGFMAKGSYGTMIYQPRLAS
ncbi:GNAT family N-acetyltransferase [Desulforamulus ferrireducens]|uniref:N-acetyltransferase domain-containing protein n=1 Tax=Desulforamulus ferrireducens TaxID=1833852 RepID=A0A1S6IYU0_9FIRM|nr:GNAT family N-acetyltransferase [Desulforamulus ferrireducens]AQS59945.1 hypothetical protein B0537_13180 [Desulforamulus ferrireducens]